MASTSSSADDDTNGPTSVPGAMPSPTRMAPTRAASLAVNSSATLLCTIMRFAAVQAWPMLRIFATSAPSTARSTSALGSTRNGALPPSSMEVLSTLAAASSSSFTPTLVDPVKVSFLSRLSAMRGPVVPEADDDTKQFTTPAGTPTSSKTSISSSDVSGVSWAGFSTAVQPAASAGPSLRVAMASGKFQGVMASTGPTGCLVVRSRCPPTGATV